MKKLNDFVVTDLQALAKCNPSMVKLVENRANIRKALKLGFKLPGVEVKSGE